MRSKKISHNRRSIDAFHRLSSLAIVSSTIYLVWLLFHVASILGYIFFALESGVFLIVLVFVYNHWTRSYRLLGGSYSLRASVDVFIPTVNEALSILDKTIAAAVNIDFANKTVYILDDGNRRAVRELADRYGCVYLTRPDVAQKRFKAANLNYGLKHSTGNYVLTIDADNVVSPEIVDDLLGHFKDRKVAIVASRQSFTVPEGDFNHDHLFYNYMQAGKNQDGAAISCGSGVIYRRSALDRLGGFSEWNLVEDLHTTYEANQYGYRSLYVTQPYVSGHAPRDLKTVYKQRGTWALDTLRMFFWQQPLFRRGLSFKQRLHYFEIGYCYIASAFLLPSIFVINFYTLITDQTMISGGWWYIVFRLPALVATLVLFGTFSQGQLTSRVWAGLFPVYMKASVLALLYRRKKPVYRVTSKVDTGERSLRLVIPQLAFATFGVALVFYHLWSYGPTRIFWFSCFWVIVMLYWLSPIVMKAARIKY